MTFWTNAAVNAAARVLRSDIKDSAWATDYEIRKALDVAVAVQFWPDTDNLAYQIAFQAGVEAAAKAAEAFEKNRDWVPGSLYDTLRRETAAAIRELKGRRA